jgi:hypothetical protein
MIQSSTPQTGHPATQPLARAELLTSALKVLDHARSVEADPRLAMHAQASQLMERLAAHREILARRAANVALATAVSSEELRDLRSAASRLVAVQGRVTRRLGGIARMN